MFRYFLTAVLVLGILFFSQFMLSRQVQAQTEVVLMAMGQAGVLPPYRPPVPVPQAIPDLLEGQIGQYSQEANEVQIHITKITAEAVGYHVLVATGDYVPKDDWIREAQAHLDARNAHIAVLQAHQ